MFGGAYVVDQFTLVLTGAVPGVGLRRRAAVDQLHRRGRLLGGGVLHPHPVVGARHDDHGVGPRPHRHLHRPRAAVDPRLHAGRLAQARPQGQRGRHQVLPDGRVRLGRDALRHVADLRLHRHDRAGRDRRQGRRRPRRRRPARHARHRVRAHRLRLQGVGRAVPQLGARHLRGRAHAGHRVPRHRLEGGRLRGPARARSSSASTPATTSTSRSCGPSPRPP